MTVDKGASAKFRALDEGAAEKLANLMADFSSIAYSATWADGLEFVLWEAATMKRKLPSTDFYTDEPRIVRDLASLALQCDGWWHYTASEGLVFVTLSTWRKIYAERNG